MRRKIRDYYLCASDFAQTLHPPRPWPYGAWTDQGSDRTFDDIAAEMSHAKVIHPIAKWMWQNKMPTAYGDWTEEQRVLLRLSF